MKAYLSRLFPYLLFFLAVHTVLRFSLLVRAGMDIDVTAGEVAQVLLRGGWFDVVTASFVVLPVAFILLLVRQGFWQKKAGRRTEYALRFVVFFAILFGFVAEHIFWTEFSTRFNFIAVDYLVYTQEVVGNIWESYSVVSLLSVLGVLAAAATHMSMRRRPVLAVAGIGQRARGFALCLALCVGLYSASDIRQSVLEENAEISEVAANGVYNLFYAFWHNEISYEKFYAQNRVEETRERARSLLAEENSRFENEKSLTRIIAPQGKEHHKNVMLVVMENMSASYMSAFGNTQELTPNLDRLAREGFLFANTYATGTRTVRGLEAVTLSVPPTPGQSIIRRPGNANLFSLGFVFRDRGYDTKFIYGGYGYFDNMNAFFSQNGFDVVDRTSLTDDEINFANVWGVADDDMFARAIKEADASYAAGKPFVQLIMTTSNHRPYTYPEGRIDIAPKSGRLGGVKYADYSIGKLMEWASQKPWYKDTVFVFVADHTAGASGKAELDPVKYHIPMIFYAPGFIKQGRYEKIASQIDLAPILLGQLNFRYRTKFYGEDLLHDEDEIPHAFISNYQKVALVKEDEITVLAPKRQIQQLSWPQAEPTAKKDAELISDAIGYYQSASWWSDMYRREDTRVK
jgi:phosphoglycerol transferase MdoB-like AlkP superfamily enzyme